MITLLSLSLALLTVQEPQALTVRADSATRAAASAIGAGQPWRASRLLAPLLRDSTRRTPEVVLLAAEAAGAWGGWTEVDRLLAGAAWLDNNGGRGRELLTRAALARQADSAALRHARLAVADATPATRGVRFVLLARAFDRLEQRDSAARAYAMAAPALPAVADWLTFRAAAVTDDSVARERLTSMVGLPAAREHLLLADAQARERAGDLRGAAAAFAGLGSAGDGFRLRYDADSSDSARQALRSELGAFIAARSGSADARSAAGVLDSFAPLTADEYLITGRSFAQSGPAARAAAALAPALAAGKGTAQDRFAYASALFDLNRYAEAAFQFNLVRTPAALAANAAYARGRALVRAGQTAEARSALRAVVRKQSAFADASAPALLLLADLATDERRDADAREALLSLAQHYPRHRYAPAALFRAGIIAFAAGQMKIAARELDSVARRYPGDADAGAARYWAARALAATGDTAGARTAWEDVAARDPLSYYAAAASQRLGRPEWVPPPAADSFATFADLDSSLARIEILGRLGLDREARWEQDRLARLADASVDRLLATARAFRDHGLPSRGVQLGWRALARGAPRDARTFRLLFPLTAQAALEAYARDQHLDPSLVAALVRQESIFNPAATSSAGARGLMQVMPAVGRALATAAGYPLWDPVLLYQSDVNLDLGTRHLAELVRRYPQSVRVLAAYNSGTTRVESWSTKVGMADEELFAERIPFRETRDYVRIILRNQQLYRALYGLGAGDNTHVGLR